MPSVSSPRATAFFAEVQPDAVSLALLDVLPEPDALFRAVGLDFREAGERVDVGRHVGRLALDDDLAAADADDALKIHGFPVLDRRELHGVRVREGLVRKVEADLDRPRREGLFEDDVGQVAGARLGQRAVKRGDEAVRIQIFFLKARGGAFRPHRVRARGPGADPVKFLE